MWYTVAHVRIGEADDFEAYDLLDADDPFEVDGQIAHLFKHAGLGLDDALDALAGDALFYPAGGPSGVEWAMLGEVPGGCVLKVPLAPSNHSGPTKMRPIGVYKASDAETEQYKLDRGW